MTQAVALAQLGNSGVNFRNKIINGNFDIWQRGTSFTNAGYSADRWFTTADTNSGWTVSRQAFTVGQTEVPNEPTYFLRFAISASNLAGPTVQQRIEDVRTFAGKTVTATFYAKVSAGSTFTPGYFRMTQNFGSGGSADAFVIANETLTALTSSWAKYTYTFNVPSIAGKTIGAGNYVTFMFRIPDSTTTTVDFAQVQVEEGTTATAFEQRPIGTELALCQRYYEKSYDQATVPGTNTSTGMLINRGTAQAGGTFGGSIPFKVEKRAASTVTLYTPAGASGSWQYAISGTSSTVGMTAVDIASSGCRLNSSSTITAFQACETNGHFVASAEL